ncbi:hypothetical protein GCM10023187_26850 [Nibrella viscosa]|uniref:FixH protein n=1 Tax=Nibrella viscosa TaxID=1084524 RepID=A0ABP8KHS3_9BACT
MNWGKTIILTFILFAGFIGGMVTLMSRQRIDLVRDDYYQDEIQYQRQIERVSNTARLKTPVTMVYQPEQQQVAFVLPDTMRKGEITFYRPSDRRQDFRVPIRPTRTSRQVVSTAFLQKGRWRVQLNWTDGRSEYYAEQEVYIQ